MILKWFTLLSSIVLGAIGQIMLKLSTNENTGRGINFIIDIFKRPWIYYGVIMYGFSFILWLYALRHFSIGLARPLTSIGYIITYVLAVIFLGEPIILRRIAGIVIILIGVVLLK